MSRGHFFVLTIRLSVVGVVLTVCIWILVCYLIIIFTTLISTLYVYIYIFIYICTVFEKESPLFPSTTFSPITFLVCCTRYTRILTRYSVTTPNPVASWTGSFKLKGVFSRCCVHGRMCPEKFFRAHFTIDIALGHISGHISSKDTGLKSQMCPEMCPNVP